MRGFAIALLVVALFLSGCSRVGSPVVTPSGRGVSASDQAAIYSLVVRRLYGPDDTGGGGIPKPAIYLVRATDITEPESRSGESTGAMVPDAVQRQVSASLSDLKTRVVWVDRFESVSRDSDTGIVSGGGVIVRLGDIRLVGAESAHVAGSIYFANLGAGGRVYVLDRAGGVWKITGTTGVEWVS